MLDDDPNCRIFPTKLHQASVGGGEIENEPVYW